MVTQELMRAAMQERMLEADQLQIEQQARALREERSSARRDQSGLRITRLPLPPFVVRAFRTAS